MRNSGWLLPLFALAAFIACVAWPAAALIEQLASGDEAAHGSETRGIATLLTITVAWSVLVALLAAITGWLPGRVIGARIGKSGFVPLAVACLVPILVPSYVVFWTWQQSWSSGGWLYAWAARHDLFQLLRDATLLAGLISWSWPLVAWCVAGTVASRPAELDEMLQLDDAGALRSLMQRLRSDSSGLALGALMVFLATFNNTTCFDLALIRTFGYELRAIDSLGAPPWQLISTALPAIAVAAFGAALTWRAIEAWQMPLAVRSAHAGVTAWSLASIIWVSGVAIPLTLLVGSISDAKLLGEFFAIYGGKPLIDTLLCAAAAGTAAALIALGLASMWTSEHRATRILATVQAIAWLTVALVPGTVLAVGIEAAFNRGWLNNLVYARPIAMVIGYVGCFGFIGALLGRWIVAREPATLRDLRRLDGPRSLRHRIESNWPRMLVAAAATFFMVMALSMGEIPVTARLRPVGFEPLAGSILNAMHYQQPETVLVATLLVMLMALAGAIIVVAIWAAVRRWAGSVKFAACMLTVVVMPACEDCSSPVPVPLQVEAAFGTPGLSLGQFSYPRALAVDPPRAFVYVVDKTARVQRFGFDGEPQLQWTMPKFDNGKPTGISVAPDGRVFVADTHCFRVMVFDSQGHELMQFGEYGEGPGQFIFPTDVAFAPDGRIFVSEYGGNDRVQIFDASGQYLSEFGSIGSGPGEFSRPQSLAFNGNGRELFVADACNHRIQVFDPQTGDFLRMFGQAGSAPGKLAYPYGVMTLDDGSLMVCEYGNNRLQRLTAQGVSLGVWGRVGAGEGELRYPWAVDRGDGLLFVLDSGNHRVLVMEAPD